MKGAILEYIGFISHQFSIKLSVVVVVVATAVVIGFNVPSTAKVIRRRDPGFKSHPKDWRCPGSSLLPLVYKTSSFTNTPRRFLAKWCGYPLKLPRQSTYYTCDDFCNTLDNLKMGA